MDARRWEGGVESSVQVVFGLGNPGRSYEGTRHNVGFDVLDELAARHGLRFRASLRLGARVCSWRAGDREVWLVKPQQYMNRSGQAVARFRRRRGTPIEGVLVVVDDVELPLGRLRLRKLGGAGGHNGLRSVIAEAGGDGFPRIRVGIGGDAPGADLTGHVLGRFRPEERAQVQEAVRRAADAVECILEEGMDAAMNRYNAKT